MEEKNQETVIDKVENRMVKFSIIVPVYKVEAYLDRCVDSLIHQTVDPEQLEILLVDDGSPDRCGALCDQYAEQYPFVIKKMGACLLPEIMVWKELPESGSSSWIPTIMWKKISVRFWKKRSGNIRRWMPLSTMVWKRKMEKPPRYAEDP